MPFDKYAIYHAFEEVTANDDDETKAYIEREIVDLFGDASSPLPTDDESTREGGGTLSEARENSIAIGVNQPANNVASLNVPNEFVQDNDVRETDVLFHKGRQMDHPGNRGFKNLLENFLGQYRHLRERERYVHNREKGQIKKDKTKLLQTIVKSVHADGGRFLRKRKDETAWEVMDTKSATDKVSHKLRDILNRSDR